MEYDMKKELRKFQRNANEYWKKQIKDSSSVYTASRNDLKQIQIDDDLKQIQIDGVF